MIRRTSCNLGRSTLAAVFAFTVATSPAQAADEAPAQASAGAGVLSSSSLAPGQRVRVTAASTAFTGVAVGNLVKIGSDRLTLFDPKLGAVTELPLSSLTRIEVSRERRSTRKGLLIGLGIGAFTAVVVAADSSESCGGYNEPRRPCTNNEKVAVGAAALGIYGGGGAWLGHRKKSDVWSEAPIPEGKQAASDLGWQVSPTLSPQSHGAGLRVRLSF